MYTVIGGHEVNVQLLRTNTVYKGYQESDPVIRWFWEVVEAMSPSQRIQFLQFTTARSRLPVFNYQSTFQVCVGVLNHE